MDHLQKFASQFRINLFVILLSNSVLVLVAWWTVNTLIRPHEIFGSLITFGLIAGLLLVITTIVAWVSSAYLLNPIRFIWQSVLHIAPDTANTPAPDPKSLYYGREFVTLLTAHIYNLANVVEDVEKTAKKSQHNLNGNFVADSLPLPLLVLDKDANIVFANKAFLVSFDRNETETTGANVYSALDLLFDTKDTLDVWLEEVRANQVTATKTWERVRLNQEVQKYNRYFDLVAYYNKNNSEGFEIMLVLFDRTTQYGQDERAMNFVALAAHELRTPLTLLRGYIDAFEEELDGKLSPEMTDFMRKMKAAAQQLSAFTTTILDVARFENDELVLKLHKENLGAILQLAVNNMQLRAQVRGITISLKVEDSLPLVAADAVSIDEVVSNLLDNAIKYSAKSDKIVVHAYMTNNGMVETTVQDFGVGIPESAISKLFNKFYRDYRNRNEVGGTGMGLYISKAILDAHGGNIWVQSKEGRGTTFGFTLTPFDKLADEAKKGDNMPDITRTAHGWIKNHSLYRR